MQFLFTQRTAWKSSFLGSINFIQSIRKGMLSSITPEVHFWQVLSDMSGSIYLQILVFKSVSRDPQSCNILTIIKVLDFTGVLFTSKTRLKFKVCVWLSRGVFLVSSYQLSRYALEIFCLRIFFYVYWDLGTRSSLISNKLHNLPILLYQELDLKSTSFSWYISVYHTIMSKQLWVLRPMPV